MSQGPASAPTTEMWSLPCRAEYNYQGMTMLEETKTLYDRFLIISQTTKTMVCVKNLNYSY